MKKQKKPYQKPKLEIIEMEPEERIASCLVIYYSSHTYQGCNEIQFQDAEPSNCIFYQDSTAS